MKGFPKCLCIAATSMAQLVRTAAWRGTHTVPGMVTLAPGSSPLGSGEYQAFMRNPNGLHRAVQMWIRSVAALISKDNAMISTTCFLLVKKMSYFI